MLVDKIQAATNKIITCQMEQLTYDMKNVMMATQQTVIDVAIQDHWKCQLVKKSWLASAIQCDSHHSQAPFHIRAPIAGSQ